MTGCLYGACGQPSFQMRTGIWPNAIYTLQAETQFKYLGRKQNMHYPNGDHTSCSIKETVSENLLPLTIGKMLTNRSMQLLAFKTLQGYLQARPKSLRH